MSVLPVRVWRRGVDEDPPRRVPLRAGPFVLWREGGDVCSVMLGGREAVRRIYVAVRNRDWGTVAPRYADMTEKLHARGFRIAFTAHHEQGPIRFSWKGSIAGEPDGSIRCTMDGEAKSTFLRNRIGFCVLHPDSAAGASCTITHADGSDEQSTFPRRISPHQPFLDLRAIRHEVSPGRWIEVLFEGDVFETEDQRNWTDASFKTYCTPLSLPFPVEISAGSRVSQAVTVRLSGPSEDVSRVPVRATVRPEVSCSVDLAAPERPLPRWGLGVSSLASGLSAHERSLLSALRIDHLRVDLDLGNRGVRDALQGAAAQAASLGAGLEAALFLSDEAARELTELRRWIVGLPTRISRWLVFRKGELSTTERWVDLARQSLSVAAPGVPIGSGSDAYFTELNRGSPPGKSADFLVFSVNPQIHAFDDRSLMETLAIQPVTVAEARELGAGRPVAVSPVTLRPRSNVVATGPTDPVAEGELPPQVDPRQMSLFAAAWTLGSAAGIAEAGASSVTYHETVGWRGVIEQDSGCPLAARFPSLPGMAYPVYHVIADLGELKGGVLVGGHVSEPRALAGLSIRSAGGTVTLLANLTSDPLTIRLTGRGNRARVRILDESTAEDACLRAEEFRRRVGRALRLSRGSVRLSLLPYGVCRVDWEV